jgi:transposase
MWTPDTRAEHDRDELRYPSDLTDAEWQILAPLLPPPAETGRHRSWPMREMMNAIFFVLRGVVRGACCRNTFRRTKRSIAGSPDFATTEPGHGLTTYW